MIPKLFGDFLATVQTLSTENIENNNKRREK